MKQLIITIALFCIGNGLIAQSGDDLFFSEYLEGTSQNKALEIFNPTPDTINLDNYEIWRFGNGATNPSDQLPIQLIDGPNIIPPYSTIIITNGQIEPNVYGHVDTTLYEMADMTGPGVYPSPMYFNGDDAIVLVKDGSTPVDLIGVIGQDPGEGWCDEDSLNYQAGDYYWLSWTSQNRLVRKPSVTQGITVNPDSFDPSVQWDSIGWDTTNIDNNWSHLGSHNYDFYPGKVVFNVIHAGTPVYGAKISIYNQELVTDSLGMDSLSINEGAYPFQITKLGYEAYIDTLNMTSNDTTINIVLNEAPLYNVTFTVQNTMGQPVFGAQVSLEGEMAITDSSGLATIEASDGSWNFEVFADEYQKYSGEIIVDGAPLDSTVILQPVMYELVAHISYGAQNVENAYLTIGGETTNTDADGVANVMLPNGEYLLEIGKDDHQTFYDSITIQGENEFIELELLQYHDLAFSVIFNENPISEASVVLDSLELNTDSSGMAVFEVINGNYNYTITSESLDPSEGSVTISYNDTVVVVSMTDIKDPGLNGFQVHPNPTRSDIIINSDYKGIVQFYNMTGKLIDTKQIYGSLQYSFEYPGVYIVRMKTDAINVVRRIIVK